MTCNNMKKNVIVQEVVKIKVLRKLLLGEQNTRKYWEDILKEPVAVPEA